MRVRVLEERVFIHAEADAASPVIAEVKAGDEIGLGNTAKVSGVNWVAVSAQGKIGYMPGSIRIYRIRAVTVADGGVAVFEVPEDGSRVVASCRHDDRITLTGTARRGERQWVEVRTGSGVSGFVPAGTRINEIAAAESQGPLLEVTILCDSGPRRYCGETAGATLDALGADILAGGIPLTTPASSKTTGAKGRLEEWNGTLEGFALRHGRLGKLYWPVRHYSRIGLGIGIAIGVGVGIFLDGLLAFQTNQTSGELLMALPVCGLVTCVPALQKALPAGIRNICGLAAVFLPMVIGLDGMFFFMLGGAVSGALQLSFLGMAVGGAIGLRRQTHLQRPPDAPKEEAFWRIALPAACAVVVWITAALLVRHYATNLFPG